MILRSFILAAAALAAPAALAEDVVSRDTQTLPQVGGQAEQESPEAPPIISPPFGFGQYVILERRIQLRQAPVNSFFSTAFLRQTFRGGSFIGGASTGGTTGGNQGIACGGIISFSAASNGFPSLFVFNDDSNCQLTAASGFSQVPGASQLISIFVDGPGRIGIVVFSQGPFAFVGQEGGATLDGPGLFTAPSGTALGFIFTNQATGARVVVRFTGEDPGQADLVTYRYPRLYVNP